MNLKMHRYSPFAWRHFYLAKRRKKTKSHYVILTLLIIVLAFFGCGIYTDISSSADVNTDFTKYKTFAWLPDHTDTTNQSYNNEIIRNNIRNYFGQSFAERGYAVNLDTPDVLLRVVITNKKKEKIITYAPYPWPYYYSRYYYGSIYYFPYEFNYYYLHPPYDCSPYDECTRKYEYVEGSITLNVIDRKKNKLVWSGTARGDIYDPAYINENIHPAVEAIMKKYPVKQITKKKKSNDTDDIYK